jgi:hypothetical protein
VPVIDTFEKIVAYAKSHKDVWFARRGDIAAWASVFSAPNLPLIPEQTSHLIRGNPAIVPGQTSHRGCVGLG